MQIIDRVSDDYNETFTMTGEKKEVCVDFLKFSIEFCKSNVMEPFLL